MLTSHRVKITTSLNSCKKWRHLATIALRQVVILAIVASQLADTEAAVSQSSNLRMELEKTKRKHKEELLRLDAELDEARINQEEAERTVASLEDEVRPWMQWPPVMSKWYLTVCDGPE